MPFTQLIHLQYISESLLSQFHLRDSGGVPVMERFLQWLQTSANFTDLWVVGHSRRESRILESLVSRYGGHYRWMPPTNELVVAREVLRLSGADSLEFLPLGVMLLPDSYLQRLRRAHLESRSDLTEARGVPSNASAFLTSRRMIQFLSELPGVGADIGIRGAVHQLRRFANALQESGEELPLRYERIDFSAEYGICQEDVPYAVAIGCPEDIEIVVDYLHRRSSLASDDAVLAMLREYKCRRICEMASRYAYPRRRRPRSQENATPLKVLYVANRCAYSGAEETLVRMIGGFDKHDVECHAILSLPGLFERRLIEKGVVVQVTGHEFDKASIPDVRRFDHALQSLLPDIVHLNSACGQAVIISCARLGIPVVQHFRTVEIGFVDDALYSAACLISVSEYLAKRIRRHDVDPAKIRVVYDGIDINFFKPGAVDRRTARERLAIPDEANVVLTIARLVPNKRHDVLIRAFRSVLTHFPKALLILVGEASEPFGYVAGLSKLIEDLNVGDRARFLEFQEDVRFVECSADLQVLCSEDEPLGTSILESMSLGIPVIVSDGGGLREVVEDGRNGYVVPVGAPEPLARRIMDLLGCETRRREMGRNARAAIERSYSVERCAERMLEVYREIVEARQEITR